MSEDAISPPDEDDEFVDTKTACAIIGGSKPVHPAALWRGVRDGRYPKPVHIGPNSVRFIKRELRAAKEAMIAERDAAPLDAA
jgi:predicted DNA-binding transcriptional regulator AlpA